MIDVVAGTGDEAGGSASLLSGLGAEGGTVSVRTADTAESDRPDHVQFWLVRGHFECRGH